MRSKHFITDQNVLVDGLCRSLLAQNNFLKYDAKQKVVFLSHAGIGDVRVRLISGGGSGHEPVHAGYVGRGMLDAAVCGTVFASPNVDQIVSGLEHISTPQGILAIVKNYTGDKLNFALAIEEFRARTRTPVEMVLIGDDVAVPRSRGQAVGRRGLAGTVLVHKIAGAAGIRQYSLQDTAAVAQHVANNIATIGVSLDHCSVPGTSEVVSLRETEIELGMGIHNEPGVQVISPQPDIRQLVDSMLKLVLDTEDPERAYLPSALAEDGSELVLLINNLGGLSNLELSAIANIVLERLDLQHKQRPARLLVGTYLTSLDGPGFSITILSLPMLEGLCAPDSILQLLDDSTDAVAWPNKQPMSRAANGTVEDRIILVEEEKVASYERTVEVHYDDIFLTTALNRILERVISWEPNMTKFDTLMGDGDCGTTLLAGANAVHQSDAAAAKDLVQAMLIIASTARKSMGGTSGALYGLFLGALATAVQDGHNSGHQPTMVSISKSAMSALATLRKFTSAGVGSRTLMDALIPAISTLQDSSISGEDAAIAIAKALESARRGMEATKHMSSTFGRSSYVGTGGIDTDAHDPTVGIPDPGACGIVAIFEGLQAALTE